jgi:hypothetical protein
MIDVRIPAGLEDAMKTWILLLMFAVVFAACARPKANNKGGSTMDGLLEVKNIAVSIRRSPKDVYAFIANGENVPRWAKGLGDSIRRVDEHWVAEGPIGQVRVHFAAPNEFGVADHDVTLPSGVTVHNPIRVVPNAAGSTVIFTLLRQPNASEQQFADDAHAVERDLAVLKTLLEKP